MWLCDKATELNNKPLNYDLIKEKYNNTDDNRGMRVERSTKNATFWIKLINLWGKMANWEEKCKFIGGKLIYVEKLSKLGDKNLQNFKVINL